MRSAGHMGFDFVNHAGAGYFSGLTRGLLGLLLP